MSEKFVKVQSADQRVIIVGNEKFIVSQKSYEEFSTFIDRINDYIHKLNWEKKNKDELISFLLRDMDKHALYDLENLFGDFDRRAIPDSCLSGPKSDWWKRAGFQEDSQGDLRKCGRRFKVFENGKWKFEK